MIVDVQIAAAGQAQSDSRVEGQTGEQMVEKADAGGDLDFAALQREPTANLGFLCLPFNFSDPRRHWIAASRSRVAMRACVRRAKSRSLPGQVIRRPSARPATFGNRRTAIPCSASNRQTRIGIRKPSENEVGLRLGAEAPVAH